MPVLEAMACGAPVVASTAPALRELGGDAVVAVDPHDPEAIAHGLEEAISRSQTSSGCGASSAPAVQLAANRRGDRGRLSGRRRELDG